MRLVIHSEGAAEAGLKRYNGKGIFISIGRKPGLKKVINAEEKKEYRQKFVDTVVNRQTHPILKNSKKISKEKQVKSQQKGAAKRKLPRPLTPSSKVRKYSTNTTNHLINRGSGIVLD